jgi:hypothetical protein
VRRSSTPLTIGIAWVGVVVGHLVAYLLTYPTQTVRHVHLQLTGHSWMGLAAVSLLAVIPVVVLAVAIRALRSPGSWTGPALVARLLTIQIPVFGAIEILERGSVTAAAADPAAFVGLVLQVVFAVLAAWLVGVLTRVVLAVVRRFESPRARATSPAPPSVDAPPPRLELLFPSRRRAPPPIPVL